MENEQDIFRVFEPPFNENFDVRSLLLSLCSFRKGSVIVDVELTFDAKVGVSEVSALLEEATEDRRIGEFQVSEVLVGSFITGKLSFFSLSTKGKGWWCSLKENGATMM